MAGPSGQASNRPLSPHLQVYKWGPHMLVSILHRATGDAMALVGVPLLVWWLYSISAGPESYEYFLSWFNFYNLGYVIVDRDDICLFRAFILRNSPLRIGRGCRI